MGVGLGGGGAGGGRAMANEGVSEEETRKHCRVTHVSAYLWAVYRDGEDGEIHQVLTVVGPRLRPHIGGTGGRVKERQFLA